MSGSQGAGAASVSSVAASLTSFDGLRYKQGENYDRSLRWQNMKIIENIVQISVHLSAFFFRCSGYFPTILACYRCSTYTRLSSLLLLISFAILIEPFFLQTFRSVGLEIRHELLFLCEHGLQSVQLGLKLLDRDLAPSLRGWGVLVAGKDQWLNSELFCPWLCWLWW